MSIYNGISFVGILILMFVAWLFSPQKKNINWNVVIAAVGLQILFAALIFIFPIGTKLFLFINKGVVDVMNSASAGAEFLFGRLAVSPGAVSSSGEDSLGFFLAFQVFPTIIFFSSLVAILYFFGIMPWIIRKFALLFAKLMKISGAESLCAASNMFVGIESALTIKPYLRNMTRSELCTVLTAGMATVSSNVLALYVYSLKDQFPTIAGHLVSASLLSIPAALVMSKLILPENDKPKTLGADVKPYYEKEKSLFEAIINGANSGVKLIVGIMSLLIAVLGLVALVDLIVGSIGGKINMFLPVPIKWSLRELLGIIFYPFTLIIGIPPSDAVFLSKIIGERAIVTEVTSYRNLAILIADGKLLQMRSVVIATYALCGFAHVASMAIFVGGIAALAPEKTRDLAQVGFRALVAATLACLMTACVAGVFFTNHSVLLGG